MQHWGARGELLPPEETQQGSLGDGAPVDPMSPEDPLVCQVRGGVTHPLHRVQGMFSQACL